MIAITNVALQPGEITREVEIGEIQRMCERKIPNYIFPSVSCCLLHIISLITRTADFTLYNPILVFVVSFV